MAYVPVPNDLSKIKTKIAFNLTKRQLICFGIAAVIGIPVYLITRDTIGNTVAMLLMITLMLPCFLLAMYERDGLPFEKVVRNIVRTCWLTPSSRPYKTENFYKILSQKEVVTIVKTKKATIKTRQNPSKA
jgi:hypothetical protein